MTRTIEPAWPVALLAAFLLGHAITAHAQTLDAIGTRAAGMAGAQVAVADDASAAYWNPAGFASGSYFSLVVDWSGTSLNPPDAEGARRQSGFLLAFGAPALGVSYYRLESTAIRIASAKAVADLGRNPAVAGEVRVDTLTTHHLGATLVQSVIPGVAVGATLKLVRGRAGSELRPDADRDSLLADGALQGPTASKFDADVGVMATVGRVKAGLTVRNLTEPSFEIAPGGERLQLQRQARAGLALKPGPGLTIAVDLDLLKTSGSLGEARDFALGGEARLGRRAFVRSGFRFNTVSTQDVGRAPSLGLGGSFAVTDSVLIDGQITTGSERAPQGWGVSARFVY